MGMMPGGIGAAGAMGGMGAMAGMGGLGGAAGAMGGAGMADPNQMLTAQVKNTVDMASLSGVGNLLQVASQLTKGLTQEAMMLAATAPKSAQGGAGAGGAAGAAGGLGAAGLNA